MKTSIDIEDDIFALINGSQLKTKVRGGIYKAVERPADSTKEDLTIKYLSGVINEDEHTAYVNVNIYVADKNLGTRPDVDIVRMRTLATVAVDSLHRGGKGKNYRVTVESQNIFKVDGSVNPEHMLNLKLKYQYINT